jgi:hypothetical protein
MDGGIPTVHAAEQLVMNKICSFAIIATIIWFILCQGIMYKLLIQNCTKAIYIYIYIFEFIFHRYLINVRVVDDSGASNFVIFDYVATLMLNINCAELVEVISNEVTYLLLYTL